MTKEREDYFVREMLRSHIQESRDHREKVSERLATIEANSINTKERIDANTKIIARLNNHSNWMKGVIAVLTAFGLGGVLKYFTT